MKQKKRSFGKKLVHFSQWTRKPYATFCSIGKVIKICVLVDTLTVVSTQAKCESMIDSVQVGSHIDIDEVIVATDRTPVTFTQMVLQPTVVSTHQMDAAPQQSLTDFLEYIPSLDIRQRGLNDVQADLSIRGGSTDQNAIIINKINFSDPQTGHNNFCLPIDLANTQKIEIVSGAQSRILGTNALNGAVCFSTPTDTANTATARLTAGQHGLYKISASANLTINGLNSFAAAAKSHSDGYTANTDYDIQTVYYRGIYTDGRFSINAQFGLTDKKFGSNGFYTLSYPTQYEENRLTIGSIGIEAGQRLKMSANVYGRRLRDYYVLVRDNPNIYQNHHLTDVLGVNAGLETTTAIGRTTLNAEYRSERISSNRLGNADESRSRRARTSDSIRYDHFYDRGYLTVALNNKYVGSKFAVSVGAAVLQYKGTDVFPGIDVSYAANRNLKLYAAANRSYRLPTFTDLFYNDPKHRQNPDLKAEKATTYELGLRSKMSVFEMNGNIYLRRGRNIIDWARTSAAELYESQNITELNTFGQEVQIIARPSEYLCSKWLTVNQVECGYSHISVSKASSGYESLYAFDQLKHKFTAAIDLQSAERLKVDIRFVYQKRNGNYDVALADGTVETRPYNGFCTVDTGAAYSLKWLTVFAEATNIGNAKAFDFSGLQLPGRWMKAGVKVELAKR